MPPKLKREPCRSPGGAAANIGAPLAGVAVGAVPVAVPVASVSSTAYASYTPWYGSTAMANYFTAFIGGTSSLAMADASGCFGTSLWQASGRTALLNGLANTTG